MKYTNRREAGQILALELAQYADKAPVVLALPRGGVPVALEVAKALNAPLDLLFVKKIGHPQQPELALAAVVDGERAEVVLNEEIIRASHPPSDYLEAETERALAEIARRKKLYLADRPRAPIKGRTAIIVDDGIATGSTVRAAIRAIRRHDPARIVVAVPVAASDTVDRLRRDADDVICPLIPRWLRAVGMHYEDFHQVSDEEVIDDLAEAESEIESLLAARRIGRR